MAITRRQTNLLVNQDWKQVYQSFKEADFQSYDFETIRKSMIEYLRTYYPEDFNDYTESSEYIALIDLIAFLGQSLAFRTDLNARENFFDTAERRDSVLKLARLISYNAKRNVPANGLLKIDSITTTERVIDSNGFDLSNLIISWNDTTNPDWQEQFVTIFNASLVNSQMIGKPGNSQSINSIQTDEYTINLVQGVLPTYGFRATVDGSVMNFEAVSATTVNQSYIYEPEPKPSGKFNVLYRNDNQGNNSANTGYFVYFKQGTLSTTTFNLAQALANRVVNVNFDNINNSDICLYQLDSTNTPTTLWTKVPALAGINVIYNHSTDRNLYQVNTRANDQIDLVFGDGSFANVPQGVYRLYYRVSNGQRYKITPDEMQGIIVSINYVSRNNRVETLTIRASLQYTVANSDIREVSDDIRVKAPQQYYTQNRMITGEDYNIFPYVNFNSILKVKAVNRSSAGVSRFLDVLDATGKYSSTNIFGSDGFIYQNQPIKSVNFSFTSPNDINNVVYNIIDPLLSTTEMKQFYYANFPRKNQPSDFNNVLWSQISIDTNSSSGYLRSGNAQTGAIMNIGKITASALKYITVGSLLRFVASTDNTKYFDTQNQIQIGTPVYEGEKLYIYAAVTSTLSNNGVNLSVKVPTGAVLDQIIPVFNNTLPGKSMTDEMTRLIQSYKNFGIRYDVNYQTWKVIYPQDLNPTSIFDLTNTGNTSGNALDASWLVRFSFNGTSYSALYRTQEYIFGSVDQTRFYFDPKVNAYDPRLGIIVHDQIKILKINNKPDSASPLTQDQTWYIYNTLIDSTGFLDNSKLLITFTDSNFDGVPDDPDLFDNIVAPTVNLSKKYVFFQHQLTTDNYDILVPIDNTTVVTTYTTQSSISANKSLYAAGQIFYATSEQLFYKLNSTGQLNNDTSYVAEIGRQSVYFQHRHNSPSERRIDPSPNNIMDFYILTKQYSQDYIAWIRDTSGTVIEPTRPTNEELKMAYGAGSTSLDNYKALSDTLVYNSGKFKPVFGLDTNKVRIEYQAVFKVVKNPNVIVSDNDIKTSLITAINTFFDTNNWDFGETFYFSELSTYLHNMLSPNIASVIIVPSSNNQAFGSLMQINAQPDEVIISAATVDNVEIISAITATQLNQSLANVIP
jgi:hypothetical protein